MTEFSNNHPDQQAVKMCPDCGWMGTFGEMKHALWLDLESNIPPGIRVQTGGDGMNYRCPKCNYPFLRVRYDKNTIVHK